MGIRWWLSMAFALVAAVSTALVVSQFSTRSQNAFRDRAQDLALGSAVVAARDITVADGNGKLAKMLPEIARRQNLELHVFNSRGVEVASGMPRGGAVHEVSRERTALLRSLAGDRYRGSTSDGRVSSRRAAPQRHARCARRARRAPRRRGRDRDRQRPGVTRGRDHRRDRRVVGCYSRS